MLEFTRAQAEALEAALPDLAVRCFIAMRYWHPFSLETARAVRNWDPDKIVLLPLYPQFSTTTTGSSLTAWRDAAIRIGLIAPVTTLCCYPDDPAFIEAIARLLRQAIADARQALAPTLGFRVLFSAHGLPEVIVRAGDPYQWQVEQTAAAAMRRIGQEQVDWQVCYQSRATPQQWLEPSTEDEIQRAARDGVGLVVVPIAFVSEHSETLVELDIEYRCLAERLGVPCYIRVPTPNSEPVFIEALAHLVRRAREAGPGLCSYRNRRNCPAQFGACPLRAQA